MLKGMANNCANQAWITRHDVTTPSVLCAPCVCSFTPPPPQLRVLELYDVVDLFVLYEIPYTHMGMEKPLYFNDSLASE